MPKAPKKVCSCGKISDSRLCPDCAGKSQQRRNQVTRQYDNYRGTRTQRGYNNRWIAYSKSYRHENPLCVYCLEKGKLTNIEGRNGCVDHIIPVSGPDDPLFWDVTNHQGICWSCHSIKTSTEDGGFGNKEIIRII